MRVKVSEYSGSRTAGYELGPQVYELIEPALARGEVVVLDFEGVRRVTTAFFARSVGDLIEKDVANRLKDLLRCENLSDVGKLALQQVVEHFTRRRENPLWAAGWDAAAQRYSESWRE